MKNIRTVQDFQKVILRFTALLFLILFFLIISFNLFSQVFITGGPQYTQDFGTTDITGWTNNTTFTGWYSTHTSINHENITNTPPINTGGFYSYECNGDNDQKIGTRPSNSTPGSVGTYIRYGVRFRNTSGQSIVKIYVSFTAYQLSLAENNNTVNQLEFHYRTSTTPITDLTSGTYTSVPALWFTAPNNHPGPGNSNQVAGYPCTVSATKNACITLSTPLANNDEIMLRWSDRNDSNNDPHLAIDSVSVWFYPDVGPNASACNTALSLEWLYFNSVVKNNEVLLQWGTASENNVSHFEVQKKTTFNDFVTIATVNATNTNNNDYISTDKYPVFGEINYYRIKQVDWNGTYTFTDIIAEDLSLQNQTDFWHFEWNGENYISFKALDEDMQIDIFDIAGRLLDSKYILKDNYTTQLNYTPGIYMVTLRSGNKFISKKIMIR